MKEKEFTDLLNKKGEEKETIKKNYNEETKATELTAKAETHSIDSVTFAK